MACYARHLLPKLSRAGLVQATAVIEPDPTRRKDAAEALGLAPEQCFPTPGDAWNRLDADALVIASPVAAHYATALEAAAVGLHLFIEKPVSDSMARCRGVLEAVRAAGVKAAVNMSACHDPEKRAFASALASGRLGTLEYIFTRLAWDHAAAAKHRATAPHPYLMEGGVHVLEMLRTWSGGRPSRVFNLAWKSGYSPYTGNASNLVSTEMDNGVRCALEGSWTTQATVNGWRNEYIRADGSAGSLLLDRGSLTFLHGAHSRDSRLHMETLPVPSGPDEPEGTEVLLREFIGWIQVRQSSHPTDLETNPQTMALLFAACASAESGNAVDSGSLLAAP